MLTAVLASVVLSSAPLVETQEGWIRGVHHGETDEYLGIPFAQPPLGSLRWKAPQPVSRWSGVLDTREFKEDCIQDYAGWASDPVHGSEDCLYLNVYTPTGSNEQPDKKYPVMAFIPGGGYWWESAGSTDCPHCPVARSMVRLVKDVIVVAIPYRVGSLGFLGGETLRARGGDGSTGNWGIQDQRAGLQWIQRNIARFGGDPDNVSFWGQSSGAGSVSIHLTSQRSQGLFHKAILMSGSFPPWISFSSQASGDMYEWVLLSSGCKDKSNPIECLENLTKDEIIAAQRPPAQPWKPGEPIPPVTDCDPRYCWFNVACRFGSPYMPEVDGVEIANYPSVLLDEGSFYHVPILHGKTRDDGRCFLDESATISPQTSEADMWEWASLTYQSPYPDTLEKLKTLYPPSDFEERAAGTSFTTSYFAATEMSSDFNEQCPTYRVSKSIASRGVPVYEYVFTYDNFYDKPFCDHSADLAYTFHRQNYLKNQTPDPEEAERVSDVVATWWANFARNGNPNDFSGRPSLNFTAPFWTRFETSHHSIMEIGVNHEEKYENKVDYRRDYCEFWDSNWEYFHQCIPQPIRPTNSSSPALQASNLNISRPWCKKPDELKFPRRKL
eukprot:TRINITY_DN240_c5_g1_i1.p1 TRINITY_DN240_c5_g1~~TRINITY_DN240_c5_g1_i1.p1  ORF type:complete len:611 (+),score=110.37 TRINITY_DN240_c5_g1_i1:64-1896(+)